MLLVTGAAGHSAKFFFERLVEQNYQHKIRCLVRKSSKIDFLKETRLDIEFCYGDIEDIHFLKNVMTGVSTVLHIAGIPFSEKIVKTGTESGVEWFICIHTTGRYSKFKSASAEYIRIEEGLLNKFSNLTILRPTMIYGSSSDRNMWKLINYINSHKIFPVFGSGENLMQPVHAKDLGDAYALVLNNKKTTFGKQYNLSGKNEITYISLLKVISSSLNRKIIFVHFPLWMCVIGAHVYNFIFRSSAFISVEQVLRMQEDKAFSSRSAFDDFSYSPMSFEEGIKIEVNELLRK